MSAPEGRRPHRFFHFVGPLLHGHQNLDLLIHCSLFLRLLLGQALTFLLLCSLREVFLLGGKEVCLELDHLDHLGERSQLSLGPGDGPPSGRSRRSPHAKGPRE